VSLLYVTREGVVWALEFCLDFDTKLTLFVWSYMFAFWVNVLTLLYYGHVFDLDVAYSATLLYFLGLMRDMICAYWIAGSWNMR